ncbi:tetratricopeptide repeat protein [Pseudomonas citronellolis]|uniref:tetratricopeptide repeat protein n=1 Tax=Pseudomonas citronellolis TaxID=53408 RepID=UPI000852EBF5|nr:hypothetical protein [Pseudomonas humi]
MSANAWGALVICLLVVGGVYALGVNGTFYFDDFRPFSALASVTDSKSAIYYIFSDSSGPLGRPLSMLSFLLNRSDWPDHPAGFFRINILIHLVNGVLFVGAAHVFLRLLGAERRKAVWMAVFAAAFWLVLPLHVSTSLIAVQRMASLSALFVFAGVWMYLHGLFVQERRFAVGVVWQAAGLAMTIPAILAKESGALLPVFVFVLEVTALRGVVSIERWRRIRVLLSGAALVLLVGYLGYTVLRSAEGYADRDFNLAQRLMTEPQILWEYLRLAFLPTPFAFTPFHDNYSPVVGLQVGAVLAIVGWLFVMAMAVVWGRCYPMFCFAVFWFLAAHLLESTVIRLELYFEHRNYVAMFGPCVAVAWMLGNVSGKYRRAAMLAAGAYLLLLLGVLGLVTSQWGNPKQAAIAWFASQPGSVRASEHLTLMLLQERKLPEALLVTETQVKNCPTCSTSVIQAMLLSCVSKDETKTQDYFERAEQLLPGVRDPRGVSSALAALQIQLDNKQCTYLSYAQLVALNKLLLGVRDINSNYLPVLVNLQQLAFAEGRNQEAREYMEKAWEAKPDPVIGEVLVGNWLREQKYDVAREFVRDRMCQHLPWNPILAGSLLQRCQNTMKKIDDAESGEKG